MVPQKPCFASMGIAIVAIYNSLVIIFTSSVTNRSAVPIKSEGFNYRGICIYLILPNGCIADMPCVKYHHKLITTL